MPQRNIKGLTGLAAQKIKEGSTKVARGAISTAKSIPSKWGKYATTNRMIEGKEVVGAAGPDLEYGIKKIGQGIGNVAGRLAYGPIPKMPSSVRPNKPITNVKTKKK